MADREIFINEFLDRLENTFSAGVECCESANDTIHAIKDAGLLKKSKEREVFDYEQRCTAHGHVEFDREAARAALDRLFTDLRDFAKEPAKPLAFMHGGKQIGIMKKYNATGKEK